VLMDYVNRPGTKLAVGGGGGGGALDDDSPSPVRETANTATGPGLLGSLVRSRRG